MDPTYEETMKRRAERRRKRRIQQQRRVAVLTAASFTLGLTVGGLAFGRKPAPTITMIETPAADHTATNDWLGQILVNSLEAAEQQEPENPCYILNNGLNPSTQAQIFRVCRENKDLYAAIMAIAEIESRMDPAAVGDDGKSIGIMQINTSAQKDRIEALGITDLKDPVQSARVAVDYIDWLNAQIQSDSPYTDHALYMAYNMGLQGSRTAIAGGTTSTDYSTAAMAMYYSNLAEMGGWTN